MNIIVNNNLLKRGAGQDYALDRLYLHKENGIETGLQCEAANQAFLTLCVIITCYRLAYLAEAFRDQSPGSTTLKSFKLYSRLRMTKLRISVISSMANLIPSRPKPESFTPP